MVKLINFSKHPLKNYTYLDLMQTVSERITAALPLITIEPAKKAALAFTAAVKQMDDEYKKATSSALTQPLTDADNARDLAYGSLSSIVTAMLTSGVPALEAAAKEVKVVLKTYSVSTAAQINEESGAMLQLCQELDKHTTALQSLGIHAIYEEMKKQNDLVRSLLKDRNAEQAFDQTGVMKKNRALVDAAFDAMSDHLNAILTLYPTEALEQTVTVINADINYVKRHNGLTTSDTGDLPESSGTTDNGTGSTGSPTEGNQSGTGTGTTPTPNPGGNGGVLE